MILEIPFRYTAWGKRPGCRTVEKAVLVSHVPVSVREVAESEAPVVARCRYETYGVAQGDRGPCLEKTEAEVDYRLVDGRLMRRAVFDAATFLGLGEGYPRADAALVRDPRAQAVVRRASECPEGVPDVTAELAQAAMWAMHEKMVGQRSRDLVLRKPLGVDLPDHAHYHEAASPFNRTERSDKAGRAAEARAAMEGGAAVVDGVLYLPSWGPAWQCDRRVRDGRTDAGAVPELSWLHKGSLLAFRDQAELEAVLSARADGPVVADYYGAVEILDPAAMPLHPDDMAMHEVAKEIADHTDSGVMMSRDPVLVHAYADVLAVARDPDHDVPAGLDALRAFADAWQVYLEPGDPRVWACESVDTVLLRGRARESGPELRAGL